MCLVWGFLSTTIPERHLAQKRQGIQLLTFKASQEGCKVLAFLMTSISKRKVSRVKSNLRTRKETDTRL